LSCPHWGHKLPYSPRQCTAASRARPVFAHQPANFAVHRIPLALAASCCDSRAKKPELTIVDDQIGSTTWARDYANATATLLDNAEIDQSA
jgi:dTDP-4-dehydrorhamnose reductase